MRADLGAGAVAVVGEHLDEHGHAAGRVALVGDRLVGDALELAGAALDGPLDGVDRHRRVAGLLEHRAQRRVGRRGRRRPRGPPPRPGGSAWRRACRAPCRLAPFLCLIVAHLEWPDISALDLRWTANVARAEPAAIVAVSSGWNDGDEHAPWRHEHRVDRRRVASTSTPAPTRSTTGARMNTAWNGAVEAGDVEVGLEASRPGGRSALRRTAMSMAPKLRWSGAAVEHVGGEQDHPGAGAEHRHARRRAARRAARTARTTSSSFDIVVDSPPGMHQRVDAVELAGRAHLDRRRRRARVERAQRARANAPCSASTPIVGRTWGLHRRAIVGTALPAPLGELGVELVDLEARHRPRRGPRLTLARMCGVAEVGGRLDDGLGPRRRGRRS